MNRKLKRKLRMVIITSIIVHTLLKEGRLVLNV